MRPRDEPVLETARLILRPPQQSDFEAWSALDDDEVATRFIGGRSDRVQSWEGLATALGMWGLRGCGLFSVLEAATGAWVGRIGPWLPEDALGLEIGWAIARPAWGQGYATEAAEAVIDWAFRELGWPDVIHVIHAENTASVAVAKRLGSSFLRDDVEHGKPVQVYGQTAEAWRARRA